MDNGEFPSTESPQRTGLRERLFGLDEVSARDIAELFDFRDLVDELDYQQKLAFDGANNVPVVDALVQAPFSEGFMAKYQEDVDIIEGNLAAFDDEVEAEIRQDAVTTELLRNRSKEGAIRAIRIRRSLLAGTLYTLAQAPCDVIPLTEEFDETVIEPDLPDASNL